jgi:hypothetical protein
MTCINCKDNKPVYQQSCFGCVVRLVKSARPSRKQQDAMLTYVEINKQFTKEQVIEAIKADATVPK